MSPEPDLATERTRREGHGPGLWVLLITGVFALDGLLRFGYFHFDDLARETGDPWLDVFVEEMTGAFATAVVFFPTVFFIRRFRLTRRRLHVHIPVLLAGLVGFSLSKTTLLWLTRAAVFPLAGLGPYDYGRMAYRYPMELFNDVSGYLLFVGGVHGWLFYRDAKQREIELERARLDSLRAQIRPHFLFNTLNAISAEMYQEPERADRLLSRLASLLRHSLDGSGSDEVTVEEELAVLRLYAEILEARFSDRLAFRFEIDPESRPARIPSFLLQPLVENAVKHGVSQRPGAGCVVLRTRIAGDRLAVEVEDDGPGLALPPDEALRSGVGLSNTAARLQVLFGDDHRLDLESGKQAGLRVRIEIPARKPS